MVGAGARLGVFRRHAGPHRDILGARHIMTNEDEAMNTVNRRTALAAGFATASLISSTSAFAQDAPAGAAEARLLQLGIELPKVAAPVANYVPAARLGNIIFLAGTG